MDIGLIDTPAASSYLGVCISTLEKYRIYGGGPRFVRVGRAVRYRLADLNSWIDARVVSSTSEKLVA